MKKQNITESLSSISSSMSFNLRKINPTSRSFVSEKVQATNSSLIINKGNGSAYSHSDKLVQKLNICSKRKDEIKQKEECLNCCNNETLNDKIYDNFNINSNEEDKLEKTLFFEDTKIPKFSDVDKTGEFYKLNYLVKERLNHKLSNKNVVFSAPITKGKNLKEIKTQPNQVETDSLNNEDKTVLKQIQKEFNKSLSKKKHKTKDKCRKSNSLSTIKEKEGNLEHTQNLK